MKMKYIVVAEESSYSPMFKVFSRDIVLYKKGVFISKYFNEPNKFRQFLIKALYKKEINRYLKNKFEFILKPNFNLINAIHKFKKEPICIIFYNTSINKYYNEFTLKKIKKTHPNIKFVLYFVDSVFQYSDNLAKELASKNIFDLVYTYSKPDAKKYGFLYYPMPYSKIINEKAPLIKGVYFCGSEKGRTNKLKRVASQLSKLGITYQFDVDGNPEHSNKFFKVTSNNVSEYEKVVQKTIRYNCILDLMQKSPNGIQPGLSLRAYEALAYNRILITNNPLIKSFEYYNPYTMHYINNETDIDKKWFNENVGNNYKGQLSPLNFLKDIEKRLNDR